MKQKVECQECGGDINVPEDAVAGEIVTCPDCGGDYEIASKSGSDVKLKPAETMGEDWGE